MQAAVRAWVAARAAVQLRAQWVLESTHGAASAALVGSARSASSSSAGKGRRRRPTYESFDGKGKVFAGCLLYRREYLNKPPPAFRREYEEWRESRRAASGFYREEPEMFVNPPGGATDDSEAKAMRVEQPLETSADASGDRQTIARRLDERLFLILRDRDSGRWHFPLAEHKAGESIRQTGERALKAAVDASPGGGSAYFIGNGPCGVLRTSLAPPLRDGEDKVFLMLAELIEGQPAGASAGAPTDDGDGSEGGEEADAEGGDDPRAALVGVGMTPPVLTGGEFAWIARDEHHEYFKDDPTCSAFLDKLLDAD